MASFILTEEMAQKAVDVVLGSLDLILIDRMPMRRATMAVVVLDPTKPYGHHNPLRETWPGDVVLYEGEFNRNEWEHPYDWIARSKAAVSWRTGLPSHLVQQRAPYLYESYNVKYGGSVVWEGGLIVAASGVEWYFDQMIANWVAAACQALSIQRMEEILAASGDRLDGSNV